MKIRPCEPRPAGPGAQRIATGAPQPRAPQHEPGSTTHTVCRGRRTAVLVASCPCAEWPLWASNSCRGLHRGKSEGGQCFLESRRKHLIPNGAEAVLDVFIWKLWRQPQPLRDLPASLQCAGAGAVSPGAGADLKRMVIRCVLPAWRPSGQLRSRARAAGGEGIPGPAKGLRAPPHEAHSRGGGRPSLSRTLTTAASGEAAFSSNLWPVDGGLALLTLALGRKEGR